MPLEHLVGLGDQLFGAGDAFAQGGLAFLDLARVLTAAGLAAGFVGHDRKLQAASMSRNWRNDDPGSQAAEPRAKGLNSSRIGSTGLFHCNSTV